MTSPTLIIGAGAWGKALAHICVSANPSEPVILIARASQQPPDHNASLPVKNKPQISHTYHLESVIKKDSPIIIATPSNAIAETLEKLKKNGHRGHVLCAAKGLTTDKEHHYPHELYKKINPRARSFSYLYGPTFADEVIQELPTQAILASTSCRSQRFWQHRLNNNYFQTILSNDMRGIAWCSVFKNIVAILAGCMQSCNLGYNAQALLITHAIEELKSIIKNNKGKEKTAFTLAGLGDIVLSATSRKSRNYQYGKTIAQQNSPSRKLPEGIVNLQKILKHFKRLQQHKVTLVTLTQDCIKNPSKCRDYLIQWIQKTAQRTSLST